MDSRNVNTAAVGPVFDLHSLLGISRFAKWFVKRAIKWICELAGGRVLTVKFLNRDF